MYSGVSDASVAFETVLSCKVASSKNWLAAVGVSSGCCACFALQTRTMCPVFPQW